MDAAELIQRIAASHYDAARSIFEDDDSPLAWMDTAELAALQAAETQTSQSTGRVWIGPIEPIRGQTMGV